MTTQTIIQNSQILLPSGELKLGDVAIESGQIVTVGDRATPTDDVMEIDGTGLTLLPGVIDPQVHFRDPSMTHKEDLFTATCACAKGGVTSELAHWPR